MLPIVLGLSNAAVCIILEVCFSSSSQCHMLKILHNVGPGFSLSQEFKTSSCECEFSFGHYCLHFTITDNLNLIYYYSHFFKLRAL